MRGIRERERPRLVAMSKAMRAAHVATRWKILLGDATCCAARVSNADGIDELVTPALRSFFHLSAHKFLEMISSKQVEAIFFFPSSFIQQKWSCIYKLSIFFLRIL